MPQTKEFLRKLRKKYGLGEFRLNKLLYREAEKTRRAISKGLSKKQYIALRRVRKKMARRHYRRGGGGFSMKNIAFGAIAGVIAGKFLGDNMLVRGGAGYLVGGLGGAVAGIIAPFILGNFFGSGQSNAQTSSYNSGQW